MRSAADIRGYLQRFLNHLLIHPGMYSSGRGCIDVATFTLHHLAFIDEQEEKLAAIYDRWKKTGASLPTGVEGAFTKHLGGERASQAERVLSMYAETAFHMGYLDTARRVSASEWKALTTGLQQRIRSRHWTRTEIRKVHGTPSITIGSLDGYTDNRGAFCFFDYDSRRADATLLMVRRPAKKFSAQFILSPAFETKNARR